MKSGDLLICLIMCLIWSADYIVAKEALYHFSPIFFVGLKFFVVSLFFIPLYKRILFNFKKFFVLSFVLVIMAYSFADIGLKLNGSVTIASVIMQCDAIVGVVLAALFLKERLTKHNIIGGLISFFGMLLIITSDIIASQASIDISSSHVLYSLVFLIAATISWPLYTIWVKKLANEVSFKEIIGYTAFIGSLQALVLSCFFESGQIESLKTIDLKLFAFILYEGLFGILISNYIWHHLTYKYTINKIACFSLLIPVFSSIGGVLYFHEHIESVIIVGSFFVLFGLYINNLSNSDDGVVYSQLQ